MTWSRSFWLCTASLIHLLNLLSSFVRILPLFQLMVWLCCATWSLMADLLLVFGLPHSKLSACLSYVYVYFVTIVTCRRIRRGGGGGGGRGLGLNPLLSFFMCMFFNPPPLLSVITERNVDRSNLQISGPPKKIKI